MTGNTPIVRPTSNAVAAFLKQASSVPATVAGNRGRLLFAMDATASRGPTWTQAIAMQSDMFREAAALGGLEVQLAYYRGLMEFAALPWTIDAGAMVNAMRGVGFLSGETQIERVLKHAAAETRRHKLNAVVFIGDAVEESADLLTAAAGSLGLLGIPVFVFHEGGEEPAATVFKSIARLTRGAYASFDANSSHKLRDLLRGVAAYAAGGRKALAEVATKSVDVKALTSQFGG
ncbi:MAG: VWA domain-containing protein [Alphaproteobacteria bacterium]|nr:VWA domain-containing protein [Alphaproteobacteria bacterium]